MRDFDSIFPSQRSGSRSLDCFSSREDVKRQARDQSHRGISDSMPLFTLFVHMRDYDPTRVSALVLVGAEMKEGDLAIYDQYGEVGRANGEWE